MRNEDCERFNARNLRIQQYIQDSLKSRYRSADRTTLLSQRDYNVTRTSPDPASTESNSNLRYAICLFILRHITRCRPTACSRRVRVLPCALVDIMRPVVVARSGHARCRASTTSPVVGACLSAVYSTAQEAASMQDNHRCLWPWIAVASRAALA